VPATTPITGERTVFPVLARDGHWLKVRLPGRPNGHTGWIRRDATALFVTDWHIVVDLSRRQVTVYRAGHPVQVFRAVVGKPSTPTPLGEFFVEE
jgi:L,D-transpeptidase catalytic domain